MLKQSGPFKASFLPQSLFRRNRYSITSPARTSVCCLYVHATTAGLWIQSGASGNQYNERAQMWQLSILDCRQDGFHLCILPELPTQSSWALPIQRWREFKPDWKIKSLGSPWAPSIPLSRHSAISVPMAPGCTRDRAWLWGRSLTRRT